MCVPSVCACVHFVLISTSKKKCVVVSTNPDLVRVSFGDSRHGPMVPDVVQLRRRYETVVLNSPNRRLDVEGVAPGEPYQLRVARNPVIGCSLSGAHTISANDQRKQTCHILLSRRVSDRTHGVEKVVLKPCWRACTHESAIKRQRRCSSWSVLDLKGQATSQPQKLHSAGRCKRILLAVYR